MDIFSELLDAELERRVKALQQPYAFAVWLPGRGWLKHEQTGRVFEDKSIEVVQTAARFYPDSIIMPIDLRDSSGDKSALELLEGQFLAQEQKNTRTVTPLEPRGIRQWLTKALAH